MDDTTVRFISNTMDYKLEGIYADLVAGKAAISKSRYYINRIGFGQNIYRYMYEWGKLHYDNALSELKRLKYLDTAPSMSMP